MILFPSFFVAMMICVASSTTARDTKTTVFKCGKGVKSVGFEQVSPIETEQDDTTTDLTDDFTEAHCVSRTKTELYTDADVGQNDVTAEDVGHINPYLTKWTLVDATAVKDKSLEFNCIGTDMSFNACCKPAKKEEDKLVREMFQFDITPTKDASLCRIILIPPPP